MLIEDMRQQSDYTYGDIDWGECFQVSGDCTIYYKCGDENDCSQVIELITGEIATRIFKDNDKVILLKTKIVIE